MSLFQRQYNDQCIIPFPLITAGDTDFDKTPVSFEAGDVQISKDGGAFINTTNLPTYLGNGIYILVLTAVERACAFSTVTIIDQSGSQWEDQALMIQTAPVTALIRTITFPLIVYGDSEYNKIPATFEIGDVKISKDGGAFANTTNLPAYLGNGVYKLVLTTEERNCEWNVITIIDQTAPQWEDQAVTLEPMTIVASYPTVSDAFGNTPAEILATYLQTLGTVTAPSAGGSWPLFTGSMPDGRNAPNDAACVYDTVPVKDGRLMAGAVVVHYGVMMHVRSMDMTTGWQKINALALDIDAIRRTQVTVGVNEYRINNVTRIGSIACLGQEEETRRYVFSLNLLMSIKELV
jgi:hypothetical protein